MQPNTRDTRRDEIISSLYLSGTETVPSIAKKFSVSSQRISQILARNGISPARARNEAKQAAAGIARAKHEANEARAKQLERTLGCGSALVSELRRKFTYFKRNAFSATGKRTDVTFLEYATLVAPYAIHGDFGRGKWVLARINPEHGYTISNLRMEDMTTLGARTIKRTKSRGLLCAKPRQEPLLSISQTCDLPINEFYRSQRWRRARMKALIASNGRCACCGRDASDGVKLQVDHIRPRSKFPKLALDPCNLQVLCRDCNLGKSDFDCTDWKKTNAAG